MKMEIKIGDCVRVKPGVKNPDYEYDLCGWQGRVTHIDTDDGIYIEIAWDSITLDQMPAEYIKTSMEDFSWEEPYSMGVFDQVEYEQLKKKRASYTDQFSLVKLDDSIDDFQGILVKVKRTSDNKTFVLPLWDLKTVDRKDSNHQIIDNYAHWMINYR